MSNLVLGCFEITILDLGYKHEPAQILARIEHGRFQYAWLHERIERADEADLGPLTSVPYEPLKGTAFRDWIEYSCADLVNFTLRQLTDAKDPYLPLLHFYVESVRGGVDMRVVASGWNIPKLLRVEKQKGPG